MIMNMAMAMAMTMTNDLQSGNVEKPPPPRFFQTCSCIYACALPPHGSAWLPGMPMRYSSTSLSMERFVIPVIISAFRSSTAIIGLGVRDGIADFGGASPAECCCPS